MLFVVIIYTIGKRQISWHDWLFSEYKNVLNMKETNKLLWGCSRQTRHTRKTRSACGGWDLKRGNLPQNEVVNRKKVACPATAGNRGSLAKEATAVRRAAPQAALTEGKATRPRKTGRR